MTQTDTLSKVDGWNFSLGHAFVFFSAFVGAVLLGLFGVDLATGVPLQRFSVAFDVANVIGGLGIVYLSWNTYQDLK